jgi:hypothetical protein
LEDPQGVSVAVGKRAQPGLLHARRQSDDPASLGHPQRATDRDDGAHGSLLLTVQVHVADRGGGLRKATTCEHGRRRTTAIGREYHDHAEDQRQRRNE